MLNELLNLSVNIENEHIGNKVTRSDKKRFLAVFCGSLGIWTESLAMSHISPQVTSYVICSDPAFQSPFRMILHFLARESRTKPTQLP